MLAFRTISVLLLIFICQRLHAKPNNEQLYKLGKQLVLNILRGSELPPKQQVINSLCWKEDFNEAPNIYLTENSNYDSEQTATPPFLKLERAVTIVGKNIALNDSSFKDSFGHPLVDYLKKGSFSYSFVLQSGNRYIGCAKGSKSSTVQFCENYQWVDSSKQAIEFQVIGQLMKPTDEDLKTRLRNKGVIQSMVTPLGAGKKLGIVFADCLKTP